jgi:hypothetical protein
MASPTGSPARSEPEAGAAADPRLRAGGVAALGGKARVGGLGCPRCGGAIELPIGQQVAACPFCHTPLLVVGDHGIERLSVRPRVTSQAARECLATWFGDGWHKDPTLRREARVGEGFLCFLPFYRVTADVIGIALGTEQRRRTVGSGKNRRTEVYYVDVERTREGSGERVIPAVQTAEWGLQSVDLRGDELVAFERDELERQGMVFPPTTSAADALEAALVSIREELDPATGLHEVRFRFLESLRERLRLVYYPLWVLRWEHRGRSYQAVIDAEDGKLAYGKAPGNDTYRAAALVASQATAAFVLTTAIQWLEDAEPAMVALVAALAILYWGWRRFRWGGEVVEGTGLRKSLPTSLPAGLPPAARQFLGAVQAVRR